MINKYSSLNLTTNTAVVSVILRVLCIPAVLVTRSQVDVRLSSRVAHKVCVGHRVARGPLILAVLSPVASCPVVTSVSIARLILLLHVVSQALHLVNVQDVSKLVGVAQLPSMWEVLAVVLALLPVHHESVGSHYRPVPTRGSPVGWGCPYISQPISLGAHWLVGLQGN